MVKVILKGTRKNKISGDKEGFIIGELSAGVVLRESGGVFIVIADQVLSDELRIVMDKDLTRRIKKKWKSE